MTTNPRPATGTVGGLFEHMMAAGYDPDVEQPAGSYQAQDWFDLVVSGVGSVRVVIFPDDGGAVDVHMFDKFMAQTWQATFTPGTPDAAIVAVLEAAEWELADRRGGPVTDAQAQSIGRPRKVTEADWRKMAGRDPS